MSLQLLLQFLVLLHQYHGGGGGSISVSTEAPSVLLLEILGIVQIVLEHSSIMMKVRLT